MCLQNCFSKIRVKTLFSPLSNVGAQKSSFLISSAVLAAPSMGEAHRFLVR